MDSSRWLLHGPAVPLALALAAAAVIYATAARQHARPGTSTDADAPNELWRCQACAKTSGQSWIPCRVVTGRGNEKGARDRVTEVVCAEAGAPVDQCEITSMTCHRLPDEEGAADRGAPSE